MNSNHRRFLGSLDANKDVEFEKHFIESSILSAIKNNNSNIIFGSKGVGKTALRRALTEIIGEDLYYSSQTINLDKVSFESVYNELSHLNHTVKTEVPLLARSIWQNILLTYCLDAVAQKLGSKHLLSIAIKKALGQEGFDDKDFGSDTYFRFLRQIEIMFDKIALLGIVKKGDESGVSLRPSQKSIVNKYPLSEEIRNLILECRKLIQSEGKPVLICLDGFDSIVDHTPESRKAIFAGLISSIFQFQNDDLISNAFCFKAFLPQELTIDANSIVWDSDKQLYDTHYLRWNKEEFQAFIAKRIFIFSRKGSAKFSDLWTEFMPDKIRNSHHGLDEETFEYILRHTLYRPRQVLSHIQNIVDRWDSSHDSFKIDPSFIPSIVAETNYQLSEFVANQLQSIHPEINSFLRSWKGAPNIMYAEEFKRRLQKHFKDAANLSKERLFDDLFKFGIFGFANNNEKSSVLRQKKFYFSFVGDKSFRKIDHLINDDDLIAFSPMFNEFCGCTTSEHGAIIPEALN